MENRRRCSSGKVPATRLPDGSAQGWSNGRRSAYAKLGVTQRVTGRGVETEVSEHVEHNVHTA